MLALFISTLVACGGGGGAGREASEPLPDQSIEEYLNSQFFTGAALVIDQGATVLKRGFGLANRNTGQANNTDTRFRLASVTKQFTAMAIMILQERGLLSIDANVSTYIADYPRGDDILIRHLLTHTAGIIRNYDRDAPNRNVTPEELVELFKHAPLQSEPGQEYSYSNSGYKLLGLIIERVSGQSYADFVAQEIFGTLNMNRSGFGPDIPDTDNSALPYLINGNELGAENMSLRYSGGGLVSTINDLAKWDRALEQNTLVSESATAQIFTPFLSNYGFGWRIEERDGANSYYHGGSLPGFNTFILRVPEKRRLIILLSNEQGYPAPQVALNIDNLLNDM